MAMHHSRATDLCSHSAESTTLRVSRIALRPLLPVGQTSLPVKQQSTTRYPGQAESSVPPAALLLKRAPVVEVTAALQRVKSLEMRPHERTTRVRDLPTLNIIVN